MMGSPNWAKRVSLFATHTSTFLDRAVRLKRQFGSKMANKPVASAFIKAYRPAVYPHNCSGLPGELNMRTLFLAGLIALAAGPALADPCQAPLPSKGQAFAGVVDRIIAGDSFCVGEDGGGVKVRLADFDSVDRYDPGGMQAKKELHKLVYGQYVTCKADGKSFDRVVAVCTLGGRSLADQLRERGVPEGGKY
jgi:hypothetical protein